MMTFDESTNSLVFNRIKNPVKDLSPYVLDDIKASYDRMLGTYNKVTKKFEGGILLQECDRFNETLMADGQCPLDFFIEKAESKSPEHRYPLLKASPKGIRDQSRTILELPIMDALGRLKTSRSERPKAFINRITSSDDIAYEAKKNKVTIKLKNKMLSIQCDNTSNLYKVHAGGTGESIFKVIQFLAAMEGELVTIKDIFKNPIWSRALRKEENTCDFAQDLETMKAILENSPEYIKKIKDDPEFSCKGIRPILNQLVSLEQARGLKLMFPIGSLPEGTVITSSVIKQLESLKIDKLYVQALVPKLEFKIQGLINREGKICNSVKFNPDLSAEYDYTDVGLTEEVLKEIYNRGFIGVVDKNFTEYNFYAEVMTNGDCQSPNLTYRDLMGIVSVIGISKLKGKSLFMDRDRDFLKKVEMMDYVYAKTLRKVLTDYYTTYKGNTQEFSRGTINKNTQHFNLVPTMFRRAIPDEIQVTSDDTNVIAQISQTTHISTIIAKGSEDMRQIAIPYYGRICPFETPEGKKVGLTNNKALGCKIDDNGNLLSRMFPVISNGDSISLDLDNMVELSIRDMGRCRVTDITELTAIGDNKYANSKIKAIVPTLSGLQFSTIQSKDVDYVSISSEAFVGLTNSMIPFAANTDAVRASFGGKMIKAGIYVQDPDIPLVRTNMYDQVLKRIPDYYVEAEGDGCVIDIQESMITIDYNGKEVDYVIPQSKINTDSVIFPRVNVSIGQIVRKGDTIIDTSASQDGIYCPGKSMLVAYVTTSFNHEDGIDITDYAAEKLTSIGSTVITKTVAKGATATKEGMNHYFGKGTEIGKITGATKNNSMISVDTGNASGQLYRIRSRRDPDNNMKNIVEYSLMSYNKTKSGDKLSGLFGNKGVNTVTRKNEDAYLLKNGMPIEVYLNPHGLPSRMNVGQVYEAQAGLCAHVLGIYIKSDGYNGMTNEELTYLLKLTHDIVNAGSREAALSVLNSSELPEGCKKAVAKNIDYAMLWAGVFDEHGNAYLYDPKIGKYLPYKATIGFSTILKLKQEADKKEHARAGLLTEEYQMMNQQPPQGGHSGGQAYGEMELYALAAYGAANYLAEVTNIKSDNTKSKCNIELNAWGIDTSMYKWDPDEITYPYSSYVFMYMMEALGFGLEANECELPDTNIEMLSNEVLPDMRSITEINIESYKDEIQNYNKVKTSINSRSFIERIRQGG